MESSSVMASLSIASVFTILDLVSRMGNTTVSLNVFSLVRHIKFPHSVVQASASRSLNSLSTAAAVVYPLMKRQFMAPSVASSFRSRRKTH